jgi:hypothetical protein
LNACGNLASSSNHFESNNCSLPPLQEIARQAGHSNNKQKIQLHQQLKKDIQEQTALVSQLRDELVEVTLQRDAAKAELAKVKSYQKETALATGTSTRTRSAALRDVNVAAAGENSHAHVLDL